MRCYCDISYPNIVLYCGSWLKMKVQMQKQTHSTLEVFFKNWGMYQGILRERMAGLTDEQLWL